MIRTFGKLIGFVCIVFSLAAFSGPLNAQTSPDTARWLQADAQNLQWFREARFGIFICWGISSLEGTEIGWSRGGERPGEPGKGSIPVEIYDNLYKKFNPTQFDAKRWIATVKNAGAKYIVFVTKHHDGFCFFDSKLTDYTIMSSPFNRDVTAELAKACHEAGIKLGLYYSVVDWYRPDYFGKTRADWCRPQFMADKYESYIRYMHGQVRELCENYGEVAVVWFDLGGQTMQHAELWQSAKLFETIRRAQPGILINNRIGLPGDFTTPEQRIGRFQTDRPWESCITLSASQWSWKPNEPVKSLARCIYILVKTAGGDGNLLLNIGPMPTGELDPRQAARLQEIGDWLKQYGQSIYGTRGGPFRPMPWGACTSRGNMVYVHILDWIDETIRLPAINRKIVSHSVLTGGTAHVEQTEKDIAISLPVNQRHPLDTIVVLQLDGPAADAQTVPFVSGSIATGKKATASSVCPHYPDVGAESAVDDDYSTSWCPDRPQPQAWMEVDLGKTETIGRARLSEPFDNVQEFQIQYKEGNEWRTFAGGATIGNQLTLDFTPIVARFVRLHITRKTGAMEISEFQLFPPAKDR